jgi:predicted O-methyltransferase YrrM
VEAEQLARAGAARGFMPPDEGYALYQAALAVPDGGSPLLEIGSYCGKSAVYLGTGARERHTVLYALDHHRGSEENQPGWEWHEPDLVDPEIGRIDTLPRFRRTMHDADLEGSVVALVGDSPTVGRHWAIPLSLLFIDGGHGTEPAHRDYELWTPHVEPGGLLCIHDVFPNPADGGRPPHEIYLRALESGRFVDERAVGSLRVLRRTA